MLYPISASRTSASTTVAPHSARIGAAPFRSPILNCRLGRGSRRLLSAEEIADRDRCTSEVLLNHTSVAEDRLRHVF